MASVPAPRRRLSVFGVWFLSAAATVLGLVGGAWWLVNRNYPYGWEHCCDKQIGLALLNYADENGGRFPSGGETPEGSLGLLYPKYVDASVLRGKAYPEEPAKRLLEAGKPLTPETCGWHYVDGLTLPKGGGSSQVAIFWDKIGLGHNSEYLPDGGHSVTFMDAHGQVIKESDWRRFIAEQEKAWAAIRRGEELEEIPWVPEDSRWRH
jgi:catechol 2,3-dioxygenase-like lactoylglutathione lyase family enzyme